MRCAVLILISLCVGITSATAQTVDEVRKYDRNKNGRIDKGRELEIYLLHKASPILSRYDKNFNGIIDPEEAAAITRDAKNDSLSGPIGAQRDEILLDLAEREGIPVEDLADKGAVTDKRKKLDWPTLYVRRDKTDVPIAQFPIATPDAKGARISYSRDGISKEEVWTVDALASLVIANGRLHDKVDPYAVTLTGYAAVPWVEMRRRSSSKVGASETDKFTFGTDGELELFGQPLGGVQYLTFGADYQTDRIAKASIADATVRWQPYNDNLKIGTWFTLAPNLQFTWLTALDADYRTVQDSGTYTNMPETNYLWAGGWLKGLLRYHLDAKRDIMLTAQYDYRRDFFSKRIAQLLAVELAFPLDADGLTSVSLEYKRGMDWTTLDKFDLLTAGLNFKL